MKTAHLLCLIILYGAALARADQTFDFPAKNPLISLDAPEGWRAEEKHGSLFIFSPKKGDVIAEVSMMAASTDDKAGALKEALSTVDDFTGLQFEKPSELEPNPGVKISNTYSPGEDKHGKALISLSLLNASGAKQFILLSMIIAASDDPLAYQSETGRILFSVKPAGGTTPAEPTAPVGDVDWHAIAGSISKDGAYALAWSAKAEPQFDNDGDLSVDPEAAGLANHVVAVRSHKVIGTLVGKHPGSKSTYNHTTTETAWSRDSQFVAQVNNGKWETTDAQVYEVKSGEPASITQGTDLLKAVAKAVLEDNPPNGVQKFGKEAFVLSLHDVRIVRQNNTMAVQTGVTGQVPKNEDAEASFDVTVTFNVKSSETGGGPELSLSSSESHF